MRVQRTEAPVNRRVDRLRSDPASDTPIANPKGIEQRHQNTARPIRQRPSGGRRRYARGVSTGREATVPRLGTIVYLGDVALDFVKAWRHAYDETHPTYVGWDESKAGAMIYAEAATRTCDMLQQLAKASDADDDEYEAAQTKGAAYSFLSVDSIREHFSILVAQRIAVDEFFWLMIRNFAPLDWPSDQDPRQGHIPRDGRTVERDRGPRELALQPGDAGEVRGAITPKGAAAENASDWFIAGKAEFLRRLRGMQTQQEISPIERAGCGKARRQSGVAKRGRQRGLPLEGRHPPLALVACIEKDRRG